jgi:hypothetical protein
MSIASILIHAPPKWTPIAVTITPIGVRYVAVIAIWLPIHATGIEIPCDAIHSGDGCTQIEPPITAIVLVPTPIGMSVPYTGVVRIQLSSISVSVEPQRIRVAADALQIRARYPGGEFDYFGFAHLKIFSALAYLHRVGWPGPIGSGVFYEGRLGLVLRLKVFI